MLVCTPCIFFYGIGDARIGFGETVDSDFGQWDVGAVAVRAQPDYGIRASRMRGLESFSSLNQHAMRTFLGFSFRDLSVGVLVFRVRPSWSIITIVCTN